MVYDDEVNGGDGGSDGDDGDERGRRSNEGGNITIMRLVDKARGALSREQCTRCNMPSTLSKCLGMKLN